MTEQEARERVIRAMCPERVCRVCGEPSRRIVEVERTVSGTVNESSRRRKDDQSANGRHVLLNPTAVSYLTSGGNSTRTTLGWTDCGHDDWRPGVVLDPFA